MRFEKLNYNSGNKKRIFLYGLIVGVLLIVIMNLFLTKAKYQVTDTKKLASGTINYNPYDFKIMAMYTIDSTGKKTPIDTMPKSGYVINEKESYCTLNNIDHDSIAKLYTNDNEEHIIQGLSKNEKCYLYFDEHSKRTLENIGIKDNIQKGQTEFTGIATEEDKGLFSGEDDYGITYYYRGNIDNNWVKLGNTYWRIIRINGNGTIRLIYSGTDSPKTTGVETTINNGEIVKFNEQNNDNKYVGFMYGGSNKEATSTTYEDAHANKYKSTILEKIEEWYITSDLKTYSDLLDGKTGFCGDRSIAKENETWWSSDTKKGYGAEKTAYGAYSRFNSPNKVWNAKETPTLKCSKASNDLYTTSTEKGQGNGALTYPIGLITADEVIYAGGFGYKENKTFYLYNDIPYWTLTPLAMSPYYEIGSGAGVFYIQKNGVVDYAYSSYDIIRVRPAINLKSTVTFEPGGNGTSTNPYIVQTS